jgi:hypothetical protein
MLRVCHEIDSQLPANMLLAAKAALSLAERKLEK